MNEFGCFVGKITFHVVPATKTKKLNILKKTYVTCKSKSCSVAAGMGVFLKILVRGWSITKQVYIRKLPLPEEYIMAFIC